MKKLNATTVQLSLSPEAITAVERIARASLSDPAEVIDRIILAHVRSIGGATAGPEHPTPVEPSPIPAAAPGPKSKKRYLMRAPEMFQRGLLRVGMRLRLRSYPGHEAFVHDERSVTYRGQVMTYRAWGTLASNRVSICIYEHAVLDDGRLLGDLRRIDI